MCRRSKRCVLLGTDSSVWSTFEPLPAPTTLVASFPHFENAVRAAAAGDVERAHLELSKVDGNGMRDWFVEHAQVAGNRRFEALGRPKLPPCDLPKDELRYPRSTLLASVLAADGYRCRYCQKPVLEESLLRLFQAAVGEAAFPMGRTNLGMHGAALAYRAVVDHVIPRSRGGRTDATNLVTACYPCNYGKGPFTLDQLGMCAPRPAAKDTWDGLRTLIPELKKQARGPR